MQVSIAQDSETKGGFDKSKLFFGGNLGLAFGTYTIVNVSPLVGYQFTLNFLLQVSALIILTMVIMTGIGTINRVMWV